MYRPWSLMAVPPWGALSRWSRLGSLFQQFASREQESKEAQGEMGDDDARPLEEYEETGEI